MDLWGMASALGAAVKQQTSELAGALQNTDWRSELSALQRGLHEDTEEFSQQAVKVTQELGQKTVDAAKKLPSVMEQGRRTTVATLEQLPGTGEAVMSQSQTQLQQAGTSLGRFGQRFMQSTSVAFERISTTIQSELASASSSATSSKSSHVGAHGLTGKISLAKFNRWDADVAAMQRDSSTYCDEPEDADDFSAWLETFDLEAQKPAIAELAATNMFMRELQTRVVPVVVDYQSFWTRYFYRLHKLQERHAKVAALTARADVAAKAENLGWGDDDDAHDGDGWEAKDQPSLAMGGAKRMHTNKENRQADDTQQRQQLVDTHVRDERAAEVMNHEESKEGDVSPAGKRKAASEAPMVEASTSMQIIGMHEQDDDGWDNVDVDAVGVTKDHDSMVAKPEFFSAGEALHVQPAVEGSGSESVEEQFGSTLSSSNAVPNETENDDDVQGTRPEGKETTAVGDDDDGRPDGEEGEESAAREESAVQESLVEKVDGLNLSEATKEEDDFDYDDWE